MFVGFSCGRTQRIDSRPRSFSQCRTGHSRQTAQRCELVGIYLHHKFEYGKSIKLRLII